MTDSPDATVGHEGVAIPPDVVQPDMRDDAEITGHLNLVASYCGEEHVGDVVPDDRLDVGAHRNVPLHAAEESDDLGSSAQRLEAADLQNAVRAKGIREPVKPPGVAGPVVPGEGVPDVLASDQLPNLHRRPPQDGCIVCW